MKPNSLTTIERIQMILAEEVNKSKSTQDFIEKASKRLLELIQDERRYGR